MAGQKTELPDDQSVFASNEQLFARIKGSNTIGQRMRQLYSLNVITPA